MPIAGVPGGAPPHASVHALHGANSVAGRHPATPPTGHAPRPITADWGSPSQPCIRAGSRGQPRIYRGSEGSGSGQRVSSRAAGGQAGLLTPDRQGAGSDAARYVFQGGVPSARYTEDWANETSAAFTRLVQKELRRQALVAALDWKRPPPAVPSAQKRDYTKFGKFTCASTGVVISAWLQGKYGGRWATAGLAAIAGGQIFCPDAVNSVLSDLIGSDPEPATRARDWRVDNRGAKVPSGTPSHAGAARGWRGRAQEGLRCARAAARGTAPTPTPVFKRHRCQLHRTRPTLPAPVRSANSLGRTAPCRPYRRTTVSPKPYGTVHRRCR